MIDHLALMWEALKALAPVVLIVAVIVAGAYVGSRGEDR